MSAPDLPFREYRPPLFPYWLGRHQTDRPLSIPEHASTREAEAIRAQPPIPTVALDARIRSRLGDGSAMTAAELAQVVGCTDLCAVENALRRLMDAGTVARSGIGGIHAARYRRTDNPARRAVFRGQIRPRSGTSYQARILGLLASDPERWWIGRDIAAALDIPVGGAYSALHALNERAEVERRARGKLYSYRHKEHVE